MTNYGTEGREFESLRARFGSPAAGLFRWVSDAAAAEQGRRATAGDFTFADGAGVHCDRADVGRPSAQVTYTMKLGPGQDSTRIIAWGVNARGQTYGVQNQHGTPDLIAVIATNHHTGYVCASS